MPRDAERIDRLVDAMRRAGLDILVCSRPANVLMTSGYWPVLGQSLAVLTREGRVTLIVPADERTLAARGGADAIHLIEQDGMTDLRASTGLVAATLAGLHLTGRLGHDGGDGFEPTTYAASYRYASAPPALLGGAPPGCTLEPADALLARQRSVLTPMEIAALSRACDVAAIAFQAGAAELASGLSEAEAARRFAGPLEVEALRRDSDTRALGFTHCMAGVHSAEAGAAFARSRGTVLRRGDLALLHCNSTVDGMWTDITRTFTLGPPSGVQSAMYQAVLAARAAALDIARAGVPAAQVDAAAREVIRQHGFGDHFTHGLGHGVGFAAIDHLALPRLNPASPDVLESGMVCNIEPAIYLPGREGMRHCDMVLVTPSGVELLTPFLAHVESMISPTDPSSTP